MPESKEDQKSTDQATPDKGGEGQDKGGGSGAGAETPAALTQADLDKAVEAAAAKARAEASAEFKKTFKETTGAESPEAYKDAQLKSQGKYQEAAEASEAKAAKYDARVKELLGKTAVAEAAAGLKAVDPADVYALVQGKVEVDESEKVTIGGKEPKAFLEDLFKDKPYLVKSSGRTGSGSGPGGGGAGKPPSKLSLAEKTALIKEIGFAEYKKLLDADMAQGKEA